MLQSSTSMAVSMVPVPGYTGVYNVTLRNTGSGYGEAFVLQLPGRSQTGNAPMLVAFHRANVSHGDAFLSTSFPAECRRRGWFFVAPLGGHQRHFSSLVSQINTQRVLEYMCSVFRIDRQRIYGVGFSMGGGAVATFAARHLDPDAPHFAAIINHTGTVSVAHAFASDYDDNDADDGPCPGGPNLEAPDLMEFWNGGTPATAAFSFSRCSTIDIDPLTGQVDDSTDLARNLGYLKVMTVLATGDTHPYLSFQTQTWIGELQRQGIDNTFVSVPYVGHSWNALDDHMACEWFDPIRAAEPTEGSELADEDGQSVQRFHVQQDQSGAFTPFRWDVDANANRLSLWGSENLRRISVDAESLGLAYAGTLRWNHMSADGSDDELLLLNVPYAPAQITRDGQPAACVYDAQLGTCLFTNPGGAAHLWQIRF
jgi:acetyl esterase/lipase